jgi:hypothetical protein
MQEILTACGYYAIVTGQVASEALWILDENGERERIPIGELDINGTFEIWSPIDDELSTLIDLAATLGDGEAASLAIGQGRRVRVATDDRPARNAARGLSPPVALASTSELLRSWAEARGPDEVAGVLRRIEEGAQFVPPRQDPNAPWWFHARDGV